MLNLRTCPLYTCSRAVRSAVRKKNRASWWVAGHFWWHFLLFVFCEGDSFSGCSVTALQSSFQPNLTGCLSWMCIFLCITICTSSQACWLTGETSRDPSTGWQLGQRSFPSFAFGSHLEVKYLDRNPLPTCAGRDWHSSSFQQIMPPGSLRPHKQLFLISPSLLAEVSKGKVDPSSLSLLMRKGLDSH